jgi:hypothetical protein
MRVRLGYFAAIVPIKKNVPLVSQTAGGCRILCSISIPPMVPATMPTIIIVIIVVMIVVGAIIVCSRVVIISGIDISGIVIPSIIGPVIPWSTAKRDTEALRFRIVLGYRQQS